MNQLETQLDILVIEDNPGDQLLLDTHLHGTSLVISSIILVGTIEKAKKILAEQVVDIILLDLFLPDVSGLDSFEELVAEYPHIPIIVLSGLTDTSVALKALALGAQDYLIKGDYSEKLLEKTIRYSIERRKNLADVQEVNERYNLVARATNDIVWDWSIHKNKILYMGKGIKSLFGIDEDKVTFAHTYWQTVVHPDDFEKVNRDLLKLIDSGETVMWEDEYRLRKPSGQYVHIYDRGFIVNDSFGTPSRMIGAMQDITKRKEAELQLQLSEKRFRALVQNGSDLIAVVDLDGQYIYVSESVKSILGYEVTYFEGKNAFDMIHPQDLEMIRQLFSRLATEPYLELPRYRFKNSRGEWRWIETNVMNMLENPGVNGIIANSRDVTEKKLAEDELNKLSLVAKETLNAVIMTDEARHIIWVNNAFTNITGYQFDEVVGRKPGELLQGKDTNSSTIAYMHDRTLKKVPYECELINYTKTGKKFWTRLQVQPLFDEKGKITRYFGINTDITERVELEHKLEEEKLLKQQQITEAVIQAEERERSQIGKELHDNVNQILGASRLYIDLARKDAANQDLYLARSADYLLNAIDEIRKLSKALVTPVINELGLKEAISGIIEDLEILQPIEIILDADDFYEADMIEKFKLNAFRIVQEQLNNIIKHARATAVQIRLARSEDFIDLVIMDNGIGFDVNKSRDGVGISNIISRTELYKGRIEIKSEIGKGVLLEIRFPLADALLI